MGARFTPSSIDEAERFCLCRDLLKAREGFPPPPSGTILWKWGEWPHPSWTLWAGHSASLACSATFASGWYQSRLEQMCSPALSQGFCPDPLESEEADITATRSVSIVVITLESCALLTGWELGRVPCRACWRSPSTLPPQQSWCLANPHGTPCGFSLGVHFL